MWGRSFLVLLWGGICCGRRCSPASNSAALSSICLHTYGVSVELTCLCYRFSSLHASPHNLQTDTGEEGGPRTPGQPPCRLSFHAAYPAFSAACAPGSATPHLPGANMGRGWDKDREIGNEMVDSLFLPPLHATAFSPGLPLLLSRSLQTSRSRDKL